MKLIITENYDEMSATGANVMKQLLDRKPDASVILAMGDTPLGMYSQITNLRSSGLVATERMSVFQLDGYLGLGKDDPRSLEGWLRRTVVEPWAIPEEQLVRLAEDSDNPEEACRYFERKVSEAGGLDLAVLGLGPNGHLGFNEPPSAPDSPTRVVPLTEESIASNARYWGGADRVPRSSITAGMNVLLGAEQILLLVSGEHKQEILRKTLEEPATELVPSSFLQRHPNVTVIVDKMALPSGVEFQILGA